MENSSAAANESSADTMSVAAKHEKETTGNSSGGLPGGGLSDEEVGMQFSRRLGKILKGITAPISSSGTLDLGAAPTVTLRESGETFTIRPPGGGGQGERNETKLVERQVESLKGLTDRIPRAAFGRGQKTVYDKSIRSALQLKAEDFDVGIPQDRLDAILGEVRKDLDLQTDVVAELYSLNAYERGGKFVRHKDTPRGEDMLGTLVVCLPSLFKGGEFRVTMGKEEYTYFKDHTTSSYETEKRGGYYKWWPCSYDKERPCPQHVPWCAFFSDVDHEIKEVTSGLRMTVAYLLRRKDRQSAAPNLPREVGPEEQTSIVRDELGRALRNGQFLGGGGTIGSPCLHLYTNKEIFAGQNDSSTKPLTPKQVATLKGRDLMVAEAAASFGLDVHLVPFLSHDEQGDLADIRLKKFPKKKKCPRYMSEETVMDFFDGKRPEDVFSGVWNEADLWILEYGDSEQAEAGAGGTNNYNAEGYFGNEASETSFYVKAALFIQVPSHSEGRGSVSSTQRPAKKSKKAAASTKS